MLQPRLLARIASSRPAASYHRSIPPSRSITCLIPRAKGRWKSLIPAVNTTGNFKRTPPDKLARKECIKIAKKEKKQATKLRRLARRGINAPVKPVKPAKPVEAPITPSLAASIPAPEGSTIAQDAFSSSYPITQDESGHPKPYIKSYTPRTPGTRHLKRVINEHLWKGRPYLPLTYPKKGMSRGGRNNSGRITVRHRGGGHARRIRTVDFYRKEPGTQTVVRIEYDPNRSAHIALLRHDETKALTYVLAADGTQAGDRITSYMAGLPDTLMEEMGGKIDMGMLAAKAIKRGNCLPLHYIPLGTQIFNIGIAFNGRGQLCRSAGTFGTVHSKDVFEMNEERGTWVNVRLQSGEVRKVSSWAPATIGMASNPMYHFGQLGKAGRSRWLGIRPTVRGVAMNTNDHPHGGGRGKSKSNRIPTSPEGIPAKGGYKTRSKRKSNAHVVQPRVRNMGKRRK